MGYTCRNKKLLQKFVGKYVVGRSEGEVNGREEKSLHESFGCVVLRIDTSVSAEGCVGRTD
jgi:hypothetical protein